LRSGDKEQLVSIEITPGANTAVSQFDMRLSYLRYAVKTASDPHGMLEHESEALGLSPHLRLLLEQHLPAKAERGTADALTA
jgi:hypothetical protein